MKRGLLVVALGLLVPLFVSAKEPAYRKGLIVSMNSVPCGSQGKGHKSFELLCQEYVVRTDTLEYHIRQQRQGHEDLLPVGQQAEFRIVKDVMHLRISEPDGKTSKEHNYLVISVAQRDDAGSNSSPQ